MIMAFQPWNAALAGLSLGTLAAGKLLITGRPFGVSDAIKGYFEGSFALWRTLFVGGLVAAGFVATRVCPAAFDALPASFSLTRAALAGFLMGVGMLLGRGDTSSHGVSGIARLALRSIIFSGAFVLAAMAAAELSGTAAALGMTTVAPPYAAPTAVEMAWELELFGSVAMITALAAALARVWREASGAVTHLYEAFCGLAAGLALCVSGMVRPTMVTAALLVRSPAWNATLYFVTAGALAVALPLYHFVIRHRATALDGSPLQAVATDDGVVDARLLAGGVLFGAGWGLSGVCPGPGLVALAAGQQQMLVLVASMLAGTGFASAMGSVHASESTAGKAATA